MKKSNKIVIGLAVILTLVILAFPVFGTWTTPNTFYDVENVNLDGEATGITSCNSLSFYQESSQRWFILYTFDAGSNDFGLKYSYSDPNDWTAWNNGGTLNIGNYMTTNNGADLASGMCAWCYDNENEIGHLIYLRFIATNGVYYRNFTISGGSIVLGSEKGLLVNAFVAYGSVDICLSFDNRPICAYGGWYNPYHSWACICDSTDGYNGAWSYVEFQPNFLGGGTAIIPTGTDSCILLRTDHAVSNPIYQFTIEFGVTSNSTGGGTPFTDNSLWRYDLTNNVDIDSFSVAYGEDHFLVIYTASDGDCYAFVVDYETLTKSDEYLVDDRGDGSSGIKMAMVGGIWSNDEPFVTYMDWWSASQNKSMWACEWDQAGYDGYFNTSAHSEILANWTTGYSVYSGWGANTARMLDANGGNLIMIHDGDYIAVTMWYPIGDLPSDRVIDPLVPYDLIPLIMFLAGAVMMIAGPTIMVLQRTPESFVYMFMLVTVGLGLVIGWLYWV